MKFNDYHLSDHIKRGIENLGYKKPTDIQFRAIPAILKGEDVLAIAQTGTGKTAAFVIPVLNIIQNHKNNRGVNNIRCLVLVPTHELALQVTEVFKEIGKFTDVVTHCLIGGVEQDPQINELENGVDILVATPGRLFDLISQGYIRLNKIEVLILDEADHMLDLGFIKDVTDLIEKLPRKRQTLFFSATINDKIKKLAYSIVNKAIRIQVSPNNPVAKNIDHAVAFIEMDDKRFFLERFINEHPDSKILIFVRTIVRAERVAKSMEKVGIETKTIHRDKEQDDRFQILEDFRNGELNIVIATDVSARGIDIPAIDYVINYDLPDQPENYVHRVGRTGRASHMGHAISFCSSDEKEILSDIELFLDKPIQVLDITKSDYKMTLEIVHEKENDWQSLMIEAEKTPLKKKKKK
jgi:ATP-dependent RNA helicase RhlE